MSVFLDKKLEGLVPYTPGEQPRGMNGLIKLNTNENPFPPSPKVIEAISKAAPTLNLYSDPTCGRAAEAIAAFYGVKNENVFLSNGSDETLSFIFHGLCGNGAVFPDITYGFYKVFAAMFGVKSTVVPLDENFRIKVDDYKDINFTVVIANPNAPTGILLPLMDIERLLKQNPNRLVVVDEAYIDFGGESAVKLTGRYKNLLVVQTFSKSRSLAGGRLGLAIADEAVIADLNRMKYSFNPYNVNSLSIAAAEAAMKDTVYFEACRRTVIANRAYITDSLRGLGFTVPDSAANFIFAGWNRKISGADYYNALRENNILVRYFPEGRCADFVRISIGTMEQMKTLSEVTTKILGEI